MTEDKKSYYAIIPASVRYDKSICPNAKLLYGEITALANEKGYCWASNAYFAELYDCTPQAVSRWVNSLADAGYIKLDYKKDGKIILERRIYIDRVSIKSSGGINKKLKGYQQKVKENNTNTNNTINNTSSADAQSVFNHYYRKYESHYNVKPVCNVGRFIKQIKSMLSSSSLDELKGMIDYIWNDSFVSSAGHSPETVFTGSSVGKFRAIIKQSEPDRVEKKHTCELCGSVYTDFCRNPDCPGYA